MSDPDPGALGASDPGGHPLFPRPETATGPDTCKFDIIQIRRWGLDGKEVVYPKAFLRAELRTWEQIIDRYGGDGSFQLIAQSGKTHRFSGYAEKAHFTMPAARQSCGRKRRAR